VRRELIRSNVMDSAAGFGKPRSIAVQPLLPEGECEGAANVSSQRSNHQGLVIVFGGRVYEAPTLSDFDGATQVQDFAGALAPVELPRPTIASDSAD
jgi:hypothetical protein